jgi:1,4-alpha-glucan branching enzyme
MLFMGEEWGSLRPFAYFCDLPQLATAIREGRRKEFARFPEFASSTARAAIPDPNEPATFDAARLAWSELDNTAHSQTLEWYRRVLTLRRESSDRSSAPATQGPASSWEVRRGCACRGSSSTK